MILCLLVGTTVITAALLGVGFHHIYFDRTSLPDIGPFARFEFPTIGHIYDSNDQALVEVARQYRRITKYEDIPPIVRDAILAAEDKNFFSHSGVDYSIIPRVLGKVRIGALLAGIAKSPRYYAPSAKENGRVLRRRDQTLGLMARNGFISRDKLREAEQRPIPVIARPKDKVLQAAAVVENVFEELKGRRAGLSAEDLRDGRFQVYSTVDARVQQIVNVALEHGLELYEKRHPSAKGLIQGSVVVLRNRDAGILAETGGRQFYEGRSTSSSDFNRVRKSLRQPGSAMKPMVYLAAFRQGTFDLDTMVPDQPINVPDGGKQTTKWISNYDGQFHGMIPLRKALAESRNAVAIWITEQIGIDSVLQISRRLGGPDAVAAIPVDRVGRV